MSASITEYQPTEFLRPFVEFFWEGDFNTTFEPILKLQVVPNGYIELIIHLSDQHCDLILDKQWAQSPDYTIIGLYTQPYKVQFRDLVNVFGIRFKPEGIFNLFGIPASVFSEGYEDMELVLGKSFQDYCIKLREANDIERRKKLTEEYLSKQLQQNTAELTYVNRAAELIRQPNAIDKIEELPNRVYVSLRQLEREFKKKIGTTPKRYMRINRLNDVHQKLEEGKDQELTEVAFDCGYADQSHFIRDFKSIMGVKPTLFIKNREQFIVNYHTSR